MKTISLLVMLLLASLHSAIAAEEIIEISPFGKVIVLKGGHRIWGRFDPVSEAILKEIR